MDTHQGAVVNARVRSIGQERGAVRGPANLVQGHCGRLFYTDQIVRPPESCMTSWSLKAEQIGNRHARGSQLSLSVPKFP